MSYAAESREEDETKLRPLCGNGQEWRQAVESWNSGLKNIRLRPDHQTTDTKAGGADNGTSSLAQASLVLERCRPGVIAISTGVASSGLQIPRVFLTGTPWPSGTALLLMQ